MATPEEELELSPTVIRGTWHPGTGREPTQEEYRAWSEETPPPPDIEELKDPELRAPAPEPAIPTPAPWTPESGREPTPEEFSSWSAVPEPPPPPEPVPAPLTPEEQLRATPGMQPEYIPAAERMRETDIDPMTGQVVLSEEEPPMFVEPPPQPTYPPIDEEIPPWAPESGVEPTAAQYRQWSGLEPGENLEPKTPRATVNVNPVNLPAKEYDDVGRLRTALGNFTQSAGRLISGIPKAVQLWFAPDVDFLEWMDDMDRIDATDRGAFYEQYDRKERATHLATGINRFGTAANVFTSKLFDMYIETKDNTGDTLTANRKRAKEMYLEAMQKTVDRPLYRAGEIFDEVVRDTFPANPEYQDEWLAGHIPSGLGSVTGYMAVFLTTRRPTAAVIERTGVAPTGFAAKGIQASVTSGVGVTTQQAFAFETALREGASIEDAMRATYSGYTYLAGASEAIPIANFFSRADKASGGAIKRAILRMFIQGGEELAQESFQTVMENMTAQDLYDPERQLWVGVGQAGAVGFTTGAIVEFLASLTPGRRRGTAQRGVDRDEASLADQLEAARQGAAEVGGDELDQAESMSELLSQLAEGEVEYQRLVKERLAAQQEAREERPGDQRPLAVLAEREADIARLPFEQKAEVAAAELADAVAASKEAAFQRAEAEEAEVQEAEVQEAEYQRELEIGAERERVGEAVEAQEVEPARVADILEPEVREGLERIREARAAREEEIVVPEEEEEEPVLALPAPPIRVTPEGEALLPAEAAAREEAKVEARRARVATGQIERPFVVDEAGREVQAPEVAERAAALTEQLELPVGEVTAAAQEAATSPTNDLVVTRKQLEAGTYKKGRLTPNQTAIPGVNVAIESPAGSVRTGVDWTQDMYDHYGYISRTESAEGPDEQLDVFVNPEIMEQSYDTVFVVDQVNDDGSFDEHKVMMGYQNQMEAVRAYKRNNPRGRKVGTITPMSKIEFRGWLETGDQTSPVAEQPAAPEVLAGEEEFGEIAARRRRGRGRRRERKPVVRFRAGEEPAPVAQPYSRMREAVEAKMPANLPIERLQQFINRQVQKGTFTREEAMFYNLSEQLEGRTGTVTREEILDIMDFRRPAIEEVLLQAPGAREFTTANDAAQAIEAVYGPVTSRGTPTGAIVAYDNEEGKHVATVYFDEMTPGDKYTVLYNAVDKVLLPRHLTHQAIEGGADYREILIVLPKQAGRFEGRFSHAHYPDQENVIAFARVAIFEAEDGRKVFMVLEVQSDWHQTGRKLGYRSPAERAKELADLKAKGVFPNGDQEWLNRVLGHPEEGPPVDYAPYEKSWPLMAMRRMINHAVAEGADVVAWPDGGTIAEMYNERMNVDEVSYNPEAERLTILDESGEIVHEESLPLKNVHSIIGKELGDRLEGVVADRQSIRDQYTMSTEYDEDAEGYPVLDPNGDPVLDWAGAPFVVNHPEEIKDVFLFREGLPGSASAKLTGTALKMGGKELINFYNKELKNVTNKWIKRFGSKVGALNVMVDGAPVEVFGFDVTTEMQVETMVRGYPHFRVTDETAVEIVEVKDAKAAVKPLTDELVRLRPTIVAKPSDGPAELYRIMRQRKALNAKGAYFNGKLYIFANNHSDVRDIVRTMLHEGVAHQGLRALYQNEAELNDILDEVYGSLTEEQIESLRGRARAYAAIDLTTPEGRRELAEEHIAHLAETDPQHNIIQRLVAKIRQMLREAGVGMDWTNDDIVNLIQNARRELREFVPLERITVTSEITEVEQRADIALRQHGKRVGVVEALRECL